jgi:hypothetical protein
MPTDGIAYTYRWTKPDGKQGRKVIGHWPVTQPGDARELARKEAGLIDHKGDTVPMTMRQYACASRSRRARSARLCPNSGMRVRSGPSTRAGANGALIAYDLIRREIASAAWEAKLAPTNISFVRAFHTIQHEMMWAVLTPAKARSNFAPGRARC